MEDILHYSEKNKLFWFRLPMGAALPEGMRIVSSPKGRACSFSTGYPSGFMGLRTFKGRNPSGKADSSALAEIARLKQIRENIASYTLVNQYADLFRLAPYEHQKKAIEHFLGYSRIALLLEQGMGKTFITLMALRILKEMGAPHKALIVCPNIVFGSWLREAQKATDLKLLPYRGSPDMRAEQRSAIQNEEWDAVLTTFDMLSDKEQSGYSKFVIEDAWASMPPESRAAYIERLSHDTRVTEDMLDLLSKPKETAKWITDCAKVIRGLPLALQPISLLEDKRREHSNTAFLKRMVEFDNLIVDEASRCVNKDSARSHHIEDLSIGREKVVLLSGTLCVGRPTDMYEPMRILDPSILGMNWTKFKNKYCTMNPNNNKIIIGYKNLDHLKVRIDPYILAMTREECLDLPERIITQRYYELPQKMKDLYNEIATQDTVKVQGETIFTTLPVVKIIKCMQVLSGFVNVNDVSCEACSSCPKILECVALNVRPGSRECINPEAAKLEVKTLDLGRSPKLALLEEDLADCGDEKVIIWAWYRKELQDIENLLKSKEIPYVTASDADCDQKFESDPNIRVFLGQTVQGIGITLNSATTTIYFSHGTALEPRLQSMDRNHRIGQTKNVVVKDYVCWGSVEENIVSLLEHKRDVRDFMQNAVGCLSCYKMMECQKDGVSYLNRGCLWFGDRKTAEKKRTIKVKELM